MRTITLAATLLILATAAQAQSVSRSDVDATPAVKTRGYSPGTVGAMEAVTQGLATNLQDVEHQQTGHLTATQVGGQSPGTVGAFSGR